MNNRKEILEQKITQAGATRMEDKKELLILLENKVFQRFLCAQLVESDNAITELANQDFTTETGVKRALLIQAKAKVLSTMVDSFLDFVTTEDQPTEGEPNNVNR